MEAQNIVTVLASGGGGAALAALVTGTVKWLSGASGRERARNTDLISQRRNAVEERDKAEGELDVESRKRREAEEHVSLLKRQLLVNGFTPVERRPQPTQE